MGCERKAGIRYQHQRTAALCVLNRIGGSKVAYPFDRDKVSIDCAPRMKGVKRAEPRTENFEL